MSVRPTSRLPWTAIATFVGLAIAAMQTRISCRQAGIEEAQSRVNMIESERSLWASLGKVSRFADRVAAKAGECREQWHRVKQDQKHWFPDDELWGLAQEELTEMLIECNGGGGLEGALRRLDLSSRGLEDAPDRGLALEGVCGELEALGKRCSERAVELKSKLGAARRALEILDS